RQNSTSPRNQTSTLTSALQGAGATAQPILAPTSVSRNVSSDGRLSIGARQDSTGNIFGSYYGSGARPISVKDRPRRESNTNGSLLNGMSWGGVSVGSWIRDDVIMAGTSPYAFGRSPSFHSSSYLPKMEANFMKDFNCCGLTLDSLHELLQHFEECHAQPSATMQRPSISGQGFGGGRGSISSGINDAQHQQQAPNQQHGFRPQQFQNNFTSNPVNNGFSKTQLSTVQDMDTLEDMEMDDPQTPLGGPSQAFPQQQQFGQNNDRTPTLNIGLANAVQNQGFRTSTPTTPSSGHAGYPLQNNPTVSSVNTPSLGAGQNRTPDSSVPGTPGDFDQDLGNYFGGMPMLGGQMMGGNDLGYGGMGFPAGLEGFDGGTIDQPAKRLFSKQGGGLTPQQLQFALRQGKLGPDSELAKQIRAQQMLAGISGIGFPGEEIKPFKCPVIGCEKAYKNQNGLKYHKQHGHQNQQLKENSDGTFSIVDPETSVPYPGTVGMEKEKPYRCETCGKRYKNLNGLKYHRAHSPPCNPELKLNALNIPGLPANLQGMNVNVAGAGL
ncbi:hypothetical protein K490DRAFT_19783, partial [Saccharata proteae CBS 121410]